MSQSIRRSLVKGRCRSTYLRPALHKININAHAHALLYAACTRRVKGLGPRPARANKREKTSRKSQYSPVRGQAHDTALSSDMEELPEQRPPVDPNMAEDYRDDDVRIRVPMMIAKDP